MVHAVQSDAVYVVRFCTVNISELTWFTRFAQDGLMRSCGASYEVDTTRFHAALAVRIYVIYACGLTRYSCAVHAARLCGAVTVRYQLT
jgi:hypothetical protein